MYLKLLIIFGLLFLYLSQVRLQFFTFPLFYFFSILGFIIFVIGLFNNKLYIGFFRAGLANLLVIFIYLLTYLFNQSGDFLFLREIVMFNYLSLFFCIFLYFFVVKTNAKFDFIKIILYVFVLQYFISLIAFFNDGVFSFIFNIFPLNLGRADLDEFNEIRMVVLGVPFFGSAVICSVFLIFFANYINSISKNKLTFLALFVFLCCLSILSARTTIFGVILSFFVLLDFNKNNIKNILYLIFLIVFSYLIFIFFSKDQGRLNEILTFGFEFIYRYNDSQASETVDGVVDMLKVFPDNYKTWLIGDGYFKSNDGFEYYKGIDIGFLRIIFNFGLVGLIVYIYTNLNVLLHVSDDFISKKSKFLIFLVFFILMIKGLANVFPYLILLYTLYLLSTKNYLVMK